jgi:hypothetical protein
MVSPLFIEIFGGLVFLALIRVGFLYPSKRKTNELMTLKVDQRFYIKALNDFYKNPNNLSAKETVYYFGHLYYAHDFPDLEKETILDYVLNDLDIPNPKEKRDYLINKDLVGKKIAA